MSTLLRLDVYDITNTSLLGTLSEAYDRSMIASVEGRGVLTFSVDDASTADLALLAPRRIVRAYADQGSGYQLVESFIIDDQPTVLDDVPSRVVRCQGLLGWLGYDRGGAVMWPRGGLDGIDPRLFGWQGLDYDDSAWDAPVSFGTKASPVAPFVPWRPSEWPVEADGAYRLYGVDTTLDAGTGTLNHPAGITLYRQQWTISDSADYVLVVNGENWQTWIDGDSTARLLAAEGGRTVSRTLTLEAGTYQFSGSARNGGFANTTANNVSWLMWSLHPITEDGELDTPVVQSDPADVVVLYDPEPWPGVTAGFILDTVFQEAEDRHPRPWSWDFDEDVDSYGETWEALLSHRFRVARLGRVVDDLAGMVSLDVWATPAGVIRAAPLRGSDLSGSVTIDSPFGLRTTGEGPALTRALYQTPSGFGLQANTAAETEFGVMEDVLTLGTAIDTGSVATSVNRFVTERSAVFDEIDVELPDDVKPYEDVELGDRVTIDGYGTYRLMTFELADNGENPEWAAFAVPFNGVAPTVTEEV